MNILCSRIFRDPIRKLQERLEFIEDFKDSDSPSSSGSAHVSHQALLPSSFKKPGRESRMQRNTREDMSIPGQKHVVAVREELRRLRRGNGFLTGSIREVTGVTHVGCGDFFHTSTLAMFKRISG